MHSATEIVVWLVVAAALLGAIVCIGAALRHLFSSEARERRRRMRSHGKVVSKARGPTIKLAVKTEEPRDRQKP